MRANASFALFPNFGGARSVSSNSKSGPLRLQAFVLSVLPTLIHTTSAMRKFCADTEMTA